MFIPILFLIITIPITIFTGGAFAPASAWAIYLIAKKMEENEKEEVQAMHESMKADREKKQNDAYNRARNTGNWDEYHEFMKKMNEKKGGR